MCRPNESKHGASPCMCVFWPSKVVHSQEKSGMVLVDWLRPAPLSDEKLTCVCEVGDVPLPQFARICKRIG